MKHARIIIGLIAMHIIAIGIPALAQEETDITATDAWKSCVRTLRISDEVAMKGTYKIRVQQCIDDSHTASTEHNESTRMLLRIRRVQRRFFEDSGSFVQTRIITPPDAGQLRLKAGRMQQEQLRALQLTRESVDRSRPSRRGIKEFADAQTRASKDTGALEYRQRWQQAVDACSTVTNNFWRQNCIRLELRKLGE